MATYYGTCYNSKGQAMTSNNGISGFSFYVEVTYTQNVTNNTSTLTIKPYVVDAHGGAFTWKFKVDGVEYYSVYQNTYNNSTVSGSSTTKTITHNADGTKTFTLNVSMETSYSAGSNDSLNTYCIQSASLSQSITLTTIPRASDFSFSDFTMGAAGTITISRASSSFTHKVSYGFGSVSGTISSNATTSASWTPSKDLGKQIPSSLSGVGTLTVATYNGSTLIGSKSKTFTLWVSGDMYPTFTSISVTGVSLFNNNYVQSKSKVTLAIIGAAGSYGSSITGYSISGSNLSSSSSSGTSGYLSVSGSQTYTAKITDSRGRTCTKTTSIYVYPYISPSVSFTSVSRADSSYVPKDDGVYASIYIKYSITDIAGLSSNTKTYSLNYKVATDTTWTSSTGTLSSYSSDLYQIPLAGVTFDLTKTYDLQIVITDSYGTASATAKLSAGGCLLDIEESGIGVGKYWEQGALDISGNIYVDGSLLIEEGTFSPAFYVSDGTSGAYTRRHGYYQKVGKWCTCNISLVVENFSGGSTTSNQFKIINLPFYNKGTYCAVTIGYQKGIVHTSTDTVTKAYVRPNECDIVFVCTCETSGNVYTVYGYNITGTDIDIQVSLTYKVE